MLTTFITPLLIIVFNKVKLKQKWIYFLVIILVIGVNSFQFRPQDFLGRDDQYYLNKYIPFPEASPEYKLTQEEYLRLPVNTLVRPAKIYPPSWIENNAAVNGNQNGLNADITTNFSQTQNLSYNKYNFPGWIANIDGNRVEIKSGQPFGQVTTLVPAGNHKIEFKFEETAFKLLLDITSLFSLVVAILLAASPYFNLRKKQDV